MIHMHSYDGSDDDYGFQPIGDAQMDANLEAMLTDLGDIDQEAASMGYPGATKQPPPSWSRRLIEERRREMTALRAKRRLASKT